MAQLYAGTSGFSYPGWKPGFYPADLPEKRFLEHYSGRLNCVEINYTFRRLPSASTLEGWVRQTAPNFLFSLKAHMRLTHVLRLKNAAEFTDVFLRAIDPLRSARRIGPVLYQLPPQFRCDLPVLTDYVAALPPDLRFAFEFRHPSWLNDTVYDVLRERNIALCVAESEKFEVPEIITANFVYFRLRKAEYTLEDRRAIRRDADRLVAQGKDLFVFFKHEDTPEGALYAEELLGG
jgi:uncharacterized protein YecE (DUF72 family)